MDTVAAVGRPYRGEGVGGGNKSSYSSEARIFSDVALMLETSNSFT